MPPAGSPGQLSDDIVCRLPQGLAGALLGGDLTERPGFWHVTEVSLGSAVLRRQGTLAGDSSRPPWKT